MYQHSKTAGTYFCKSDTLLRLYPVHERAVRITMTGRDHCRSGT
ncbi:MAG: hypothetical protein ACLTDS_02170 [Bianqueaceae bacterium]